MRYEVYLIVDGKRHMSQSYKNEYYAERRKQKLNAKFARYGYRVEVKTIREKDDK